MGENTQNWAKNVVFCKKALSKWEWKCAVEWNEKLKWKPKWSVLRYILRFFAVFLLFLLICRRILLSVEARALLLFFALCEPMSACRVLFLRMLFFADAFLRDAFTEELCELLFLKKMIFFCDFLMKKALLRLIWRNSKNLFFRENNGFSLYMVKYGNNYICSGYLCLFFCRFWIFGL